MGSQGKRKGRRTRSDEGGGHTHLEDGVGFPAFRHNQYTLEGEIERLSFLARGMHQIRRKGAVPTHRRRSAAIVHAVSLVIVGLFFGSLVVTACFYLASALR